MIALFVFFVTIVLIGMQYVLRFILSDEVYAIQFVGFIPLIIVVAIGIFVCAYVHISAVENGHGKVAGRIVRIAWCVVFPYVMILGDIEALGRDEVILYLSSIAVAIWLLLSGVIHSRVDVVFRNSAKRHGTALAIDSVATGVDVIPYHFVIIALMLGIQILHAIF